MGEREGWGQGPLYLDAVGYERVVGYEAWPNGPPTHLDSYPASLSPGVLPEPPPATDDTPCCWRAIWPWHRCKEENDD